GGCAEDFFAMLIPLCEEDKQLEKSGEEPVGFITIFPGHHNVANNHIHTFRVVGEIGFGLVYAVCIINDEELEDAFQPHGHILVHERIVVNYNSGSFHNWSFGIVEPANIRNVKKGPIYAT